MTYTESEILEQTRTWVKKIHQNEPTGHDYYHLERVEKMSLKIALTETKTDPFLIRIIALLHDINDWKIPESPQTRSVPSWLNRFQLPSPMIQTITQTIGQISFKGALTPVEHIESLEGRIVQDADRLDALGAIGIARTFAYGGAKGRLIYDPNSISSLHQTFDQYKKSQNPTFNHFYEKLLLLKDRMNTRTARQIAQNRHKYMEQYLEQFLEEWETNR